MDKKQYATARSGKSSRDTSKHNKKSVLTRKTLEKVSELILDEVKKVGLFDELRMKLLEDVEINENFSSIRTKFIREVNSFCSEANLNLPRAKLREQLNSQQDRFKSTDMLESHVSSVSKRHDNEFMKLFEQHAIEILNKFKKQIDNNNLTKQNNEAHQEKKAINCYLNTERPTVIVPLLQAKNTLLTDYTSISDESVVVSPTSGTPPSADNDALSSPKGTSTDPAPSATSSSSSSGSSRFDSPFEESISESPPSPRQPSLNARINALPIIRTTTRGHVFDSEKSCLIVEHSEKTTITDPKILNEIPLPPQKSNGDVACHVTTAAPIIRPIILESCGFVNSNQSNHVEESLSKIELKALSVERSNNAAKAKKTKKKKKKKNRVTRRVNARKLLSNGSQSLESTKFLISPQQPRSKL